MPEKEYDISIVGAGIVGLATGLEILRRRPALRVAVLEKESQPAAHQTSHNSGVIHSGLSYRPGSLKAKNCVRGRRRLYRFCEEYGIPYERCGKLVVATRAGELEGLEELQRRGKANGLENLRWLTSGEIPQYEPHAEGLAALHVSQTGIVDFKAVAQVYLKEIQSLGGVFLPNNEVFALRARTERILLETSESTVATRYLVNCAGLFSDEIARMAGMRTALQIIPFRGEYYKLVPGRRSLVKNLIYPVPDPRFPFLGVHFTRKIDGAVEAGPNAVLAFAREGYRLRDAAPADLAAMLAYPGFWRMGLRYGKTAVGEFGRSVSKKAFTKALQRLVPSIQKDDLEPAGSGVRAQAVLPNGRLADDFRLVSGRRMVHVLNAPSPAATASLSIGTLLANKILKEAGL